MQLCPVFAHDPNLRANRFGPLELVLYEQGKAFAVDVDAVTVGNGLLRLPYPFLDQVARTLNQDAFILLW